ncbi:MAG: hypothetical protein ACK4FK_01495 [Ferrovibrio sp.]|jgi:hypothetical protein|uniref:hypothetical protein n=1 Tax=Ferrovibrio sp. TaxID=1917215 RepID=UPI0039198A82
MTSPTTSPGAVFFLALAIILFFLVADGLVSWGAIDWTEAAGIAALFSALPLMRALRDLRRQDF